MLSDKGVENNDTSALLSKQIIMVWQDIIFLLILNAE